MGIVEIVLSLFLFVEFEIISSSADWKRTENGGMRTMVCAFRIAAAGNFPQPLSENDLFSLRILTFSDFFQSHAADKFKLKGRKESVAGNGE